LNSSPRNILPALAVSLVLLIPVSSQATPITGRLAMKGEVQIGATFLSFPCSINVSGSTPCPAGSGNFLTTGPLALGGSFVPYANDPGFTKNLNLTVQPPNQAFTLANFLTFSPTGTLASPDIALDLTFIILGTDGTTQCGSAASAGQICTPTVPALVSASNPMGLSPFNFANTTTGSTVSFDFLGNARRISTGEVRPFNGTFCATFTSTPGTTDGSFQAILPSFFQSGGTVTTAYSMTMNMAAPDLSIAKTHVGNFARGQAGALYTITVSNAATTDPTNAATVTVTDTLPAGLTATGIHGTGWTCTQPGGPCTRSDVLGAGASYPALTLTVNVGTTASSPQVNMVSVAGGGDGTPANNSASDPTTIITSPPTNVIATAISSTAVAITWTASPGATAYDVLRSSDGVNYSLRAGLSGTTFTDPLATANTAYLYVVRASAPDVSNYSIPDLATTVIFSDSALSGIPIKAVHITQLRTAVNAVAALAAPGQPVPTFTDPTITPGTTVIRAVHVNELRSALNAARSTLGLFSITYTNSSITAGVSRVYGADITDLRSGLQ
jgi:uncharacterized repeat protein (TIGR01451 family)